MTLVPAAALVPARLLGLGVTFPVTVFSALFVLGTGWVAYRASGPARELDEPIVPPQRKPLPKSALNARGAPRLARSSDSVPRKAVSWCLTVDS